MTRRFQHLIITTPLLGVALSACTPAPAERDNAAGNKDPACLNIVNGKETSDWEEVVLLARTNSDGAVTNTCTGTFVSDNTLLTAAHCVEDSDSGDVIYIEGAGIDLSKQESVARVQNAPRSTKLITNARDIARSTSSTSSSDDTPRDLAVLLFPAGTAKKWLTVGKSWDFGDTVTIVGFGLTIIEEEPKADDGVIKRRVGRNKIFEPASEFKGLFPDIITIVGPATQQSGAENESNAASGDSGGPMLVGDEIVGVLSGGVLASQLGPLEGYTQGGEATSDYVDLNSDRSQELLREAEDEGAVFAAKKADTGTNVSDDDEDDADDDEDNVLNSCE